MHGRILRWLTAVASDRRATYQTWQSPSGWDITSGKLRMLRSSVELVVRYPEDLVRIGAVAWK